MSNLLITTTSLIDGHRIDQYKGLVSTRVVTGAGFFADWAASFSDVFGGRSEAYHNQLKMIYDEVIALLEVEAVKRGANVILGLKIDHNEILGKGKQMFMVTASGTAAYIKELSVETNVNVQEVPVELFELELERQHLIDRINLAQDEFALHYNWEFITQNKIADVIEKAFDCALNSIDMEEVQNYFSALDTNASIKFLYAQLADDQKSELAINLIKNAKLLEYSKVLELLTSENISVRKSALQLMDGRKRTYTKSDIAALDQIILVLKSSDCIPDLGSDYGDKWFCKCGKTNKASQQYCKYCGHDIKGFTMKDVSLEQALDCATEALFVLKRMFDVRK